jgi:hypothetical protein
MGPKLPQTIHDTMSVLKPFDIFTMDYIGSFNPQSRNGNAYILVGVDYFSRYVITEAVIRQQP